MPRAYQSGEGPKPKKTKKTKKGRGTPVNAILYEDGSVSVTGPRGNTGVPNVGEGGPSRDGYGTVRQFGPSNVRLPDFARGEKKARTGYVNPPGSPRTTRTKRRITQVPKDKSAKRRTTKRRSSK